MQKKLSFTAPWRLAGLPKETPVLLAFSGGADSRALLHLLHRCAREDGFELVLAHVNHGIRGEEALRDREFCKRTAEALGLRILILDADVPSLAAAHRRSLEEEARLVRYEFFEKVMREEQIPLLATAHHADDNLETLLFRLARGTGARGLCGIAPVRALGAEGYLLTRPLLCATRREILALCQEQGLEYVTDSTNAELTCSRNRLRHGVVPILEELFECPQERVAQTCAYLAQDEDYLSAVAAEFLAEQAKILPQNALAAEALCALHPAVRRRALALFLGGVTGERGLEQTHLAAILRLLEDGQTGDRVSLPQGLAAVLEGGELRVLSKAAFSSVPAFRFPFRRCREEYSLCGVTVWVEKGQKITNVHNLSTAAYTILNLSSAIIEESLFWRSRREGDTIRMGGMTRKLRKLYNQRQIPTRLRDRLPLLCDAEGIVWAPFVGARDGAEDPESDLQICIAVAELQDGGLLHNGGIQ